MKICLVGYQGKMGRVVLEMGKEHPDLDFFGLGLFEEEHVYQNLEEAPKPDLILDFSNPEALSSYLSFAQAQGIPCVIATTGYNSLQEEVIRKASQTIPIFKSSNYSLGIMILNRLVKEAAHVLSHMDVDVYDVHHKLKQDAPSGTAKTLIETVLSERSLKVESKTAQARDTDTLMVHVSRLGSVVGEHRVVFSDITETIELTHRASSRGVFAQGAFKACRWLVHQGPGIYSMEDLWKNS